MLNYLGKKFMITINSLNNIYNKICQRSQYQNLKVQHYYI